jgi:hypothetical protein
MLHGGNALLIGNQLTARKSKIEYSKIYKDFN